MSLGSFFASRLAEPSSAAGLTLIVTNAAPAVAGDRSAITACVGGLLAFLWPEARHNTAPPAPGSTAPGA